MHRHAQTDRGRGRDEDESAITFFVKRNGRYNQVAIFASLLSFRVCSVLYKTTIFKRQ